MKATGRQSGGQPALAASGQFEQHENYTKQTFRSRCVIYGANGPIKLSIPVVKVSGQKQAIQDYMHQI